MKQVDLLRKIQLKGIDIGPAEISLLEGQKRPATDIELKAISEVLDVSIDWLTKNERAIN
jgi:hypothetical protein